MNWLIAFSTPLFLSRSSSGPYFLFGTCTLITTLVALAFQPETRGASLEKVCDEFKTSPWQVAWMRFTQTYTNYRENRRNRTRTRIRNRTRRGSEVDPGYLGREAMVPPVIIDEDMDTQMDVYELPIVSPSDVTLRRSLISLLNVAFVKLTYRYGLSYSYDPLEGS